MSFHFPSPTLGSGLLTPPSSAEFAFKIDNLQSSDFQVLMFVLLLADETIFQTREHLWGRDWQEMVKGIYHGCSACTAFPKVSIWNMLISGGHFSVVSAT